MPLYKSLILLILLLVSGFSILALRYAFFLFLKYLLAPRLILFILSTLLWLGSCIHCILACFLSSKIPKHSSSNHDLCCFIPDKTQHLQETVILPVGFEPAVS